MPWLQLCAKQSRLLAHLLGHALIIGRISTFQTTRPLDWYCCGDFTQLPFDVLRPASSRYIQVNHRRKQEETLDGSSPGTPLASAIRAPFQWWRNISRRGPTQRTSTEAFELVAALCTVAARRQKRQFRVEAFFLGSRANLSKAVYILLPVAYLGCRILWLYFVDCDLSGSRGHPSHSTPQNKRYTALVTGSTAQSVSAPVGVLVLFGTYPAVSFSDVSLSLRPT